MKETIYKLYNAENEYICRITLPEIKFMWELDNNTTLEEAIEHISKVDNYTLKGIKGGVVK